MAGFDMKDYVDVAERIQAFITKYPDGCLQSELTPLYKDDVLVGWLCRAYAYRSPSDERPGIGHAVEPVPGKTPYTRDSEAMNAETSAQGRAINALGFPTKHLASKQEVQARQTSPAGTGEKKPGRVQAEEAPPSAAAPANGNLVSEPQRKRMWAIAKANGVEAERVREIIEAITGQRTSTSQIPKDKYDSVISALELEPVPSR